MKKDHTFITANLSCSKNTLALAITTALSLGSTSLHAATINVTAGATALTDDAECSLVEALISANANDNSGEDACELGDDLDAVGVIILLPSGSTFTLTNALGVSIDSTIVVQGQNSTIERDVAAADFRLLNIVSGGDVTLESLTLRNGQTSGDGGGIRSDGNLTLNNSTISGNSAAGRGGGVYSNNGSLMLTNSNILGNSATDHGGGIYARSGTLSVTTSTVSSNSTNQYGGGINKRDGSFVISESTISGNSSRRNGGGLYSRSTNITVINSVVSDNHSNRHCGGIWARNRTIILTGSQLTGNSARVSAAGMYSANAEITNSVISGNITGDLGAGVYTTSSLSIIGSTISDNTATNKGGGIYHRRILNLTNSTVSGNTSNRGGGIYARGGGAITFNNATIVNNEARDQGGGFFQRGNGGGTTTMNASIIANNAGAQDCFRNAGNIVDNETLVGDDSCGDGVLTGDPMLASLANNGGPTLTHALLPGSPAINAGGVCGLATDQRGFARVDACDLGSYELSTLNIDINADSISEGDGAAATTGTVSIDGHLSTELTVTLNGIDTSEVALPVSIVIPAGQTSSVPFNIDAIDDAIIDGDQGVTITASALGFLDGSDTLMVRDDDDLDNDGIPKDSDNCPSVANSDQADFEGDGIGDACDTDTDGDGLPDDYETMHGLNPRNSFDRDADADLDGFTNLEEFEFGSDPNVADTDTNNNGVPDSVEDEQEQREVILPPILDLLLFEDT